MSSGLQFQDFGLGGTNSPFTDSVNSNYDQRNTDRDSLVNGGETETTGNKYSFLSFKFYQQYFDVDTDQVQMRMLYSVFPKQGSNFIRDHIQPTADLYGPFWICVTLVFCAAICGNFAHYIESLGENLYVNDFKLVTGISTIIACYVLLLPLFIYVLLYYRNAAIQYSFIELVALYGYSLSIFIPVSILWVLHYQWFRWLLIVVSVMLSGSVLVMTIWDAVKTDKNKVVAFGVIASVLFFHSVLAIGIKEYYFDTILPVKQQHAMLPLKSTALPLVAAFNASSKPKAEALQYPLVIEAVNSSSAEKSASSNTSPTLQPVKILDEKQKNQKKPIPTTKVEDKPRLTANQTNS